MHTILQFQLAYPQRSRMGGLLLVGLWTAACGGAAPTYLDRLAPGDGGAGGNGRTPSGLSCAVSKVLQTHCLACHGSPPAGAPMSLASYQDLKAASAFAPAKKVAERAVLRMQDAARPMPPGSGTTVSAAEVAVLQAWIASGMPAGSCNSAVPSSALTCTSGNMWTSGDSPSPFMRPGGACIACHTAAGGMAPGFYIAGTVFSGSHDANDCLGVNGMTSGMTVEITDAAGKVIVIPVNRTGNFMYTLQRSRVQFPYHAKIKLGGTVQAMTAAQMTGDCNSCHSENGENGAPGRIIAP